MPQPRQATSPESLSTPRQDAEAEKAMKRPSGKARNGGTEFAYADRSAASRRAVFVNGALAVPGASADTDTVPAKFSARNSADDQLITLAYTFKTLPNDQRQAIYQALKGMQPAAAHAPNVQRAGRHGAAVRDRDTRPFPRSLPTKVPAAKGYHYIVADNRVLLIAPASRAVVGVFTGTGDGTTGIGDERLR